MLTAFGAAVPALPVAVAVFAGAAEAVATATALAGTTALAAATALASAAVGTPALRARSVDLE